MTKKAWTKWVWYGVLLAVVCGLFAPTMVAHAMAEVERGRCPGPATGDVQ